MKIKLLLRLLFLVTLVTVHQLFGMDATLIVAAVVIVSDLDEIADALKRKTRRDC